MKIDRRKVLSKYDGHCAYCGKDITMKEMQVDHFFPVRGGGIDDFDNLMPSCRRCNHYKRANHIERFRDMMMTIHERIADNYIVKVGLDYGIVELKPFDGVFYFEKHHRKEYPVPLPSDVTRCISLLCDLQCRRREPSTDEDNQSYITYNPIDGQCDYQLQ